MRLYHNPYSSNARRAVMTALHLDIPVELVTVDLLDADDRAKLSRLNPNSKIPVLEDGDLTLWESCAIMQHLAEQVPGQTIYPSDPRRRVDINRWLFWCTQHFSPAIGIVVREKLTKRLIGAGDPDPCEVARGELQIAQFARVLDDHLAGRSWVSGDSLTLADLAIAAPLMASQAADLPLQQYAHLQAWFARVQELDCWKRSAMAA
jgi:glutathione S-transferase